MAISERKVYKELVWYYNSSSADLGISSSYGSIISSAFGFAPSNAVNHVEDKMLAIISHPKGSPIKKLRKIEATLTHLPIQYRRVLDALYGNYQFPPQLVSVFGQKTGAALFNTRVTELQALIHLCHKKLTKKQLSESEKTALTQIEQQKDELFKLVHQVYLTERNKHDGS